MVTGFEWATTHGLLAHVLDLPLALQAIAPATGLTICTLLLRYPGRKATPATADEYIRNFHRPGEPLDPAPAPARILGSIATLGLGGALGFEGPSLYIGGAVGSVIQQRFRRLAGPDAGKVLMVAGGAAGVAAIFKAPATGTVFALEVPYQDDTARHMLLPALVASASGYLVHAAVSGTEPLFPVGGTPPFGFRELGGALLLGLVCGGGARLFALLTHAAKRLQQRLGPAARIAAAGLVLAALFTVGRLLLGESLTIGPGYQVVEWLGDRRGLGLVAAVLVLRALATAATLAGGGAGGLFVPLALLGALSGRLVGGALGEDTALFPVVGVAAFLGAGYRTPLAAVMFVAESTGRPGFVVPGLVATAVSQLVMGRASVSAYQEAARVGHLEQRFRLPVAAAIRSEVRTTAPDVTLDEAVWGHLVPSRQTTICVVDGETYVGLVRFGDLRHVPRDRWSQVQVGSIARDDTPHARPDWRLEDAIDAMRSTGADLLPVVADGMAFVGVVTLDEVVRLGDLTHPASAAAHAWGRMPVHPAGIA